LLAAHFLYQEKAECLFLNGTQRVRYLYRQFYDRQEYVRFDSDLGKFVAITAFGEADADKWNREKQILQYKKAEVDSFCRQNYETGSYEAAKREERLIGRRGESWGGGSLLPWEGEYQKTGVDRFCRYNYEVLSYEAAKREERVFGRR
ncbi:HLA class II histocompatibility antigen, DRB1-4 beta chain-like, partial [Notechis scutatus]|uniref:HLA class II histocompatibility antigen, DRB1-4 beta chain-like n=1 Tax=Notechis scutatus TaxID=8663 RepID=A0A6J1WC00_9SAUR